MCKSKTFYYKGRKCLKFMKICKYCGELKLITEYYKRKDSKDGYRNGCKKCKEEKSKNIISKCDYCGKEYNDNKYSHNKNKHHFCSIKCKSKWQSENIKGENNPNWNNHILKGRYSKENNPSWIPREKVICPNCGIEFEVDKVQLNRTINNFCSINCRGAFYSREKNPNWKSNKTQEEREQDRSYPEYRQWVKDVFERDNYTCQLSGQIGWSLEAHHLDCYADFKEKRTDINNGITLTKEIHRLFHKIYGKKHNTKEQFEEFKNRFINGEFKEVV